MKNLIKILFISVFMVLSFSTSVYADGTIISVGNVSGTSGDTVKVPIDISGNTGISSFGFLFEYDSNYLTPVSAEGGVWNSDIIFNPNYGVNQAFATGAGMSNKTGDGTFIYVNFKINNEIESDGTEVSLTVKQVKHLEGTKSTDISYSVNQGMITSSSGSTSKIEIGFKNMSFKEADTIKVPLAIKNNIGISTFGICINYDSEVLTPVSVEKGIWDSDIIFNPNYSENQAFVTGAAAVNKVGDGNFIYVNFKVKKVTSATTNLSVEVKQLKTANGTVTKNVLYTATDGSISLSGDTSIYDIDGNGIVDTNDAKVVLEYTLDKNNVKFDIGKTVNGKIVGDVDGDDRITATDSAIILWVYENS